VGCVGLIKAWSATDEGAPCFLLLLAAPLWRVAAAVPQQSDLRCSTRCCVVLVRRSMLYSQQHM
jgi:hypothetical protein